MILEEDSEVICKELKDPNPSLALQGHILQDIKCLSSTFQFIGFSHVRCQGNSVAHALARRATREADLTVWMEYIPPNIHHIVQADLANFD